MSKFKEQKWPARLICYFVCLFIMSLGIAFFIKADLGVSPATSVAYAISLATKLGMGICTGLFYTFLVLLQIILLKKKFKIINILQVVVSFLFGYLTQFSQYILSFIETPSIWIINALYMLVGMLLLTFGIAIYVNCAVMPLAIDGFIKCVTDVTNKKFHVIKTFVDCASAIISASICLIFTNNLGAFGLGTIISAIFNGALVGFWNRMFIKFQKKFLFTNNTP